MEQLSVLGNADCIPVGLGPTTHDGFSRLQTWEMKGEDPQIIIRFPFVRPRFVSVEIKSLGAPLDPTIYFPVLGKFHEDHTLQLETAKAHFIALDLRNIRFERKIRIDPAEQQGALTTRFSFFDSIEDVEAHLKKFSQENDSGLPNVVKVPRTNLFSLGFLLEKFNPSLKLSRRLERVYSLASNAEPVRSRNSQDEVWLSLVTPVYNTLPRYLDDLLTSFREQNTAGVELIFSDDASDSKQTVDWLRNHVDVPNVKVVWNENNRGISAATNSAIRAAVGTWIAPLDHDDVIAPHTLKIIHNTLLQNPQTQFLYTDEVVVSESLKPLWHMAKPAYDPILLSGVNYINHFSVYRRARLDEFGLFNSNYDGSQDYELLLRYLNGLSDAEVLHLPYPGYWWRNTKGSYSKSQLERATTSARKALGIRYGTDVVEGLHKDLHRVDFKPGDENLPFISMIIPSRDSYQLISRILSDIYTKTDYPNFEVIVVDNGTTDPKVLSLYEAYGARYPNFVANIENEPFNFSRAVNRGFKLAKGAHYLLLNNDIEVIAEDWLKEMVSCLNYQNAGIVGAKLLYPDDTIQHAGVIVGASGLAGHWYYKKPSMFKGPLKRLLVRNGMVCVTGAVMLISKECKEKVGDFDEANFAIAYNDVDFCIRAHAANFRIVWTPFACLYHHESVSRGSDKLAKNQVRFQREKQNLRQLHSTQNFVDPATNPFERLYGNEANVFGGKNLASGRRWFASKT
ncbi:MAG: glycosyltransferase family 2 protein [Roseibium sp.]|uniref:glycosyltransferase family 2 protein n=1 Tax=Roseibium sp. TaxID=1936156 RepID=UPI003D9C60B1